MNVRQSPMIEGLRRTHINAFLASLMFLFAPMANARSQSSLQQVADTSPFRPLDLPTPTDVRTASGRPGAKYWQQRVDYKIAATQRRALPDIDRTNNGWPKVREPAAP